MKLRPIVFVALFTIFAGFASASDDARLSQTLSPAELSAAGLNRLTSDQIAVLDALVRRDAVIAATIRFKTPRPARFSQRLTADERHNAGLDQLGELQIANLDHYVDRFSDPTPVDSSPVAGTSSSASRTADLSAKSLRRPPEIHGMISLLYGVGSGGYSERGGAMVLSYEDPANHFAIAVGYSEVHTKGGYRYGYCGDDFGSYGYGYRGPPLR